MIDIHSHILPFVDDGSASLEKSFALIKEEVENGIDRIVLTPHYKSGHYETKPEKIKEVFEFFKNQVYEKISGVKLFLGQEVYVDESVYNKIKNVNLITINDTNCILIEFNFFDETDIQNYVYNIIKLGFTPIIAHIERYSYLDWSLLHVLKSMGALIQVNSDCIIGKYGKSFQKKALKAIKSGLIDFISSDLHFSRQCNMQKAYKIIAKKTSKEVADNLFVYNAEKHLNLIV